MNPEHVDPVKAAKLIQVDQSDVSYKEWMQSNCDKLLKEHRQTIPSLLSADAHYLRRLLSPLKKTIRQHGICDKIRAEIWCMILNVSDLPSYDRNYKSALQRCFGKNIPDDIPNPPLFGGSLPSEDHLALNKEAQKVARFILCTIDQEYPELDVCTFLPTLVHLFLHFLDPDRALGATISICRVSLSSDEWKYLPIGASNNRLFPFIFLDLLRQRHPKLAKHFSQLEEAEDSIGHFEHFWRKVFASFFIGLLPLPIVFRIVDCFLVEGFKVIFRFGLAVFSFTEKKLLKTRNLKEIEEEIRNGFRETNYALLFRTGFGIYLKREDLIRLREEDRKLLSEIPLESSSELNIRNPKIMPEMIDESCIFEPNLLTEIWKAIPLRYQIRRLSKLFSTTKDGFSLNHLYNCLGDRSPLFLVVKTLDNYRFGAYLSSPFSERKANKYYGNGECFVFSLDPPKVYTWARTSNMLGSELTAGAPDYFIQGGLEHIAIGGGGDGFAFWIDSALQYGTTNRCATFANEPLCPKQNFICSCLEVYTFV